MRCKQCDYPLWNLKSRTCPECGKPFRPSEFEFKPDSVRFVCPHEGCGQSYYGTSRTGLLEPQSFECVKCHRPVTMDEMLLLPASGVHEEDTRYDAFPWTARDLKLTAAFFKTLMLGMFQPTRLGRMLVGGEGGSGGAELEGGGRSTAWPAVRFGLLLHGLAIGLGIGLLLIFIAATRLAESGRGGGMALMGDVLGDLALGCGGAILVPVVFILIWASVAHGVLVFTRGRAPGAGPRGSSFDLTLATMIYTSAPCVFMAVPCLGPYMATIPALIWWSVCAGMVLASVHKVSGWRSALAAASVPGALALAAIGGALFLAFVTIPQAMAKIPAGMNQAAVVSATAEAQALSAKFIKYHATKGDPRHGVELTIDGTATENDFQVLDWMRNSRGPRPQAPGMPPPPGPIFVDGRALGMWNTLTTEEVEAAIARATAALPASGVHRMGDVVLCSRGVLGRTDDGAEELWIFVCCVPPATGAGAGAGAGASGEPSVTMTPIPPPAPSGFWAGMVFPKGTWLVAKADGTVEEIKAGATAGALAQQNQLRASLGLPEIPDPETVAAETARESGAPDAPGR